MESSGTIVTKNELHKYRMVIDYSQTVHRFTDLDAYPLPWIDDQINEIAENEICSTLDLKSAYQQIPLAPKIANIRLLKSMASCTSTSIVGVWSL